MLRCRKSFALANASACKPTVFSRRCIAARTSASSSTTNTLAEAVGTHARSEYLPVVQGNVAPRLVFPVAHNSAHRAIPQ